MFVDTMVGCLASTEVMNAMHYFALATSIDCLWNWSRKISEPINCSFQPAAELMFFFFALLRAGDYCYYAGALITIAEVAESTWWFTQSPGHIRRAWRSANSSETNCHYQTWELSIKQPQTKKCKIADQFIGSSLCIVVVIILIGEVFNSFRIALTEVLK